MIYYMIYYIILWHDRSNNINIKCNWCQDIMPEYFKEKLTN